MIKPAEFKKLEFKVMTAEARHNSVIGMAKWLLGFLGLNILGSLGLMLTGSWYASQLSRDVEDSKKWITDNKRPVQNMLHDYGYESANINQYLIKTASNHQQKNNTP